MTLVNESVTLPNKYCAIMSTLNPWKQRFYPQEGDGAPFDRVLFFSDAVFAIALTLMAVEIGIPEIDGDLASDPGALWDGIYAKGPNLTAYLVAFIWVAIYWRANHKFSVTLARMNGAYIIGVLVYLGFIALLPLPAGMLGEYVTNPLAVSLFAAYAATVSFMEVVLFVLADRGKLFRVPLNDRQRNGQIIGSLTPVVAFGISIPLAFRLGTGWAIGFWFVGSFALGMIMLRVFPQDVPES